MKFSRYKFIVLSILFINVALALFIGAAQIGKLWIYIPNIFNLSNRNVLWLHIKEQQYLVIIVLIFIPILIIVGFLNYRIRGKKKQIEKKNHGNGNHIKEYEGILHSFFDILVKNWFELPILLLTAFFIVFNVSSIMFNLETESPNGFAPTFIALSISIISTLVTIVSAHYAFLAEHKSSLLLNDKAIFLPHFEWFMRKTIYKTNLVKSELEKSNVDYDENKGERVIIKCMCLTPFLAHGGITLKSIKIFPLFQQYNDLITSLASNPKRYKIQILTLTPNKLFDWYRDIQWVGELEKKHGNRKHLKKLYIKTSEKQEKYFNSLLTVAGKNAKKRFFGNGENIKGYILPSFMQLRANYKGLISEKNFEVSQIDMIPFQLFLLKKNLYDSFALLTYVGSDTYSRLIEDIKNKHEEHSAQTIKGLMNNLHACFFTEDERHCKLLETHFDHLWLNKNIDTFSNDDFWKAEALIKE